MIVSGLKGIADALTRITGEEWTLSAVFRRTKRKRDPLPLSGPRYARREVEISTLRMWAERNGYVPQKTRKPKNKALGS